MSHSKIAKEQRAKEASASKYFLCLSLLGSFALHIGVLAFGVGNFLARTPQTKDKDEPIEVTIIDTPASQVKPAEAQKPEIQKLPAKDFTTSVKPLSVSKTVAVQQTLKQSPTIIQPKETHQPIGKKLLQTTLLSKSEASNQEISKKVGASTSLRDNTTTHILHREI